ncbi:MAG: GlmU family protein [Melioribacteraceae bacterium]|nr:GlmU family protein [Melioribacteraceae bacterium]
MVTDICLFEGISYTKLLPLVYFRPVYDLKCGILRLRKKITNAYPDAKVNLHCRGYLGDYLKEKNPSLHVNHLDTESCLFINGQVIVDENFNKKIPLQGEDKVYFCGDIIVAARMSGEKLEVIKRNLNDVFTNSDFDFLPREEVVVNIVKYPWDLINNNGEQLRTDYKYLTKGKIKLINSDIRDNVHLLNRDNMFIDEGVVIKPSVVLDAEDGPIYIGKNVTILPNATIQGPVYIGDNTTIKMSATIYHNTTIGRVCKVGGEIEESIIHSFSNKQHDGFLGHSYLSPWVNLGAGTSNSDLKNNYGNVRLNIDGEYIDTQSQFVGLFMGDHSKSAINTTFNTGTIVGICTNVFGAGFPSKYIPSYSWGGADALTTYDLERSIEVARRVMARRSIHMSDADERLFRKVFDLTREVRRKLGMPN